MVVNIVVTFSAVDYKFIGIDGNGIKVFDGNYRYDSKDGFLEGGVHIGRFYRGEQTRVNSDDYVSDPVFFEEEFLRKLLSEDKNIIVNKIIRF